jgi:hypothetical protein
LKSKNNERGTDEKVFFRYLGDVLSRGNVYFGNILSQSFVESARFVGRCSRGGGRMVAVTPNKQRVKVGDVFLALWVGIQSAALLAIVIPLVFLWPLVKNYILNQVTWRRQIILTVNSVLAFIWLYYSGGGRAAMIYFFISLPVACILVVLPVAYNCAQIYRGLESD